MITNNVIQRVFQINFKGQTGTCFVIDNDGKQCYVTTKHVLQIKNDQKIVVDQLTDGEQIQIMRDKKWIDVIVVHVKHSNTSDVSIFTTKDQIKAFPLPATTAGITYGQDVYFLGFPYGISTDIGLMNSDFPLPFVKKGILSTMQLKAEGPPFLLDGHNNPGFSGGPVVFKVPGDNNFKVGGIIHGYHPEYKSENGALVPIDNSNSGIIIMYPIERALELLNDIPVRI